MNADLVDILSQYATYKTRWQLAAIFHNIYHPLIAILVNRSGYPGEYAYTLSNIFAKQLSHTYEYKDITIQRKNYGYFFKNNIFEYYYIPYQRRIILNLYISDKYNAYITLTLKNLNVNIEVSLFYMDDAHSEITLIEDEYPASQGNILDIFALLDNK